MGITHPGYILPYPPWDIPTMLPRVHREGYHHAAQGTQGGIPTMYTGRHTHHVHREVYHSVYKEVYTQGIYKEVYTQGI